MYECFMSILFAICGVFVAFLFCAAGYRVSNESRYRKMKKAITYQGRIQALYDEICRSNVASVTAFLTRAAVAKSQPYQSRA